MLFCSTAQLIVGQGKANKKQIGNEHFCNIILYYLVYLTSLSSILSYYEDLES